MSASRSILIFNAFELNETSEWNGRYFTLTLIDKVKKEKDGDGGGSNNNNNTPKLCFTWWADSSDANLMNFNQESQDLAGFCSVLWLAAGWKCNQCSDMAIEFGQSEHSLVEVN